MKKLSILSTVLMIVGAVVGFGQNIIAEKQQDAVIEEKVRQALAEKSDESEEESV